MARFDRYLLRLLLLHFGFFGLVLVLVYWVNRAVGVFDQLIANGESLGVFVELSVLMLPTMIVSMLPVAVFIGAVVVTNRMASESELVAADAAGMGPFRLARPVVFYGLIAGLFMAALGHYLVPRAQARLAQRQAEIAQNITARFLVEGTFVHPAEGITIYVRKVDRDGAMHDIFLSDLRDPERSMTYTARQAFLARQPQGPLLVMREGLVQALDAERRLTTTGFQELNYDLSDLVRPALTGPPSVADLPTATLLAAAPAELARTGATRAQFLAEAHLRTSRALLTLAAALSGFSFLYAGGFSRFGLWPQVLASVVVLVVVAALDNAMYGLAGSMAGGWPLVYVAPALGLAINLGVLWYTALPRRQPREHRPLEAGA